jgi:hypothetical protein
VEKKLSELRSELTLPVRLSAPLFKEEKRNVILMTNLLLILIVDYKNLTLAAGTDRNI